jgi:membrane-associated HD superfamily phosphohydrolase
MNNMHSNIFMSQIIIYISKMTEAVSRLSIEAKIKLKYNDWEVEIICAEDKVKQVVGNVLSGIDTALFSNTKIETEIENLKSELKDIKQKYESNSSNNNNNNILNNQFNQKRNNISLKELAKNGNTCRSLIEKIFYEKYFEKEKLLGEVHEELSKMGYNYDRTAVSHSLTDMVREGILTRVGTLRNYRYIQKKPLFEK